MNKISLRSICKDWSFEDHQGLKNSLRSPGKMSAEHQRGGDRDAWVLPRRETIDLSFGEQKHCWATAGKSQRDVTEAGKGERTPGTANEAASWSFSTAAGGWQSCVLWAAGFITLSLLTWYFWGSCSRHCIGGQISGFECLSHSLSPVKLQMHRLQPSVSFCTLESQHL